MMRVNKLVGKQIINLETGDRFQIKHTTGEKFGLNNGKFISIYQIDLFEGGTYHILN